ncbi:PREDICTED: transmembrane protein adipocyte-associated 1 isoform X1 [Chinchilla lanigera]|uniref:transmembrane protein adipocyte-associated 1 isoform X1 n=1 Tax=Chinchilla lanigera TaxID=34839 RepID=UPI000698CB8A|nr:PREDICTED: transmembrane protein adipocyte-associated 1 isoform X1 [Chinchilla lanigera]
MSLPTSAGKALGTLPSGPGTRGQRAGVPGTPRAREQGELGWGLRPGPRQGGTCWEGLGSPCATSVALPARLEPSPTLALECPGSCCPGGPARAETTCPSSSCPLVLRAEHQLGQRCAREPGHEPGREAPDADASGPGNGPFSLSPKPLLWAGARWDGHPGVGDVGQQEHTGAPAPGAEHQPAAPLPAAAVRGHRRLQGPVLGPAAAHPQRALLRFPALEAPVCSGQDPPHLQPHFHHLLHPGVRGGPGGHCPGCGIHDGQHLQCCNSGRQDPVGDYPLLPPGHRAERGHPGPGLRSPGEQVKHQAGVGHHHRAVPGLLGHPGHLGDPVPGCPPVCQGLQHLRARGPPLLADQLLLLLPSLLVGGGPAQDPAEGAHLPALAEELLRVRGHPGAAQPVAGTGQRAAMRQHHRGALLRGRHHLPLLQLLRSAYLCGVSAELLRLGAQDPLFLQVPSG